MSEPEQMDGVVRRLCVTLIFPDSRKLEAKVMEDRELSKQCFLIQRALGLEWAALVDAEHFVVSMSLSPS